MSVLLFEMICPCTKWVPWLISVGTQFLAKAVVTSSQKTAVRMVPTVGWCAAADNGVRAELYQTQRNDVPSLQTLRTQSDRDQRQAVNQEEHQVLFASVAHLC